MKTPSTTKRPRFNARRWSACLALVLLTSCGGGTEQIEPFAPTSLLVFGDEMSVLTPDVPRGRKYSVNALGADGIAIDCALRPIWTQVLANTYLFSFSECNTTGVIDPRGRIYARPGAQSTDFDAQVAEALVAAGSFSATDLVTVLLGANDVIDLYQNQYLLNPDAATANAINLELQSRGARLGQRINALTALGPKVILSTMPLMGLTPFARAEVTRTGDAQRAVLLTNFSNTFNTALRVNIINDGRFIGLVELDALLNAGVSSPSQYGLNNVTQPVCAVALPNCSTATLATTDPNAANTWLWASELWMGTTGHLNLGLFARGRALGNPF